MTAATDIEAAPPTTDPLARVPLPVRTMREHGGVVFPVGRPGNPKAPHPNLGTKENGGGWIKYRDARPSVLDLDIWARWNPTGYAVVTGACSGFIDLDADDDDAVKLCESWGLVAAWTTPRGGKHFLIRHPGDLVKTVAGKSDAAFAEIVGLSSLDVRGDGQGYAVFCGEGYSWDGESLPTVNPWDSIPDDVSDYLLGAAANDYSRDPNPFEDEASGEVEQPNPSPSSSDLDIERIYADALRLVAKDAPSRHLRALRAGDAFIGTDPAPFETALDALAVAITDAVNGFSGSREIERSEVEQAIRDRRAKAVTEGWSRPSSATRRFGPVQGVADLQRTTPPLTWLLQGVWVVGRLGLLFGASGGGKTWALYFQMLAVAAGVPWLGRETTQSSVLWLAGEGHDDLAERAKHWQDQHPDADVSGFRAIEGPFDLHSTRETDDLIDHIENAYDGDEWPGVIVIETVARTLGQGDENTAKDMGRWVANVERLKARGGPSCTVIAVHHSGKDGGEERGSSALGAALGMRCKLSGPPDRLRLQVAKMRSAAEQADIFFARETTGDGVVVLRSLADPAPKDGPTTKIAQHLGPLAEAGTAGLTQAQLQERWGLKSKGTASERVKALVTANLVRRTPVAGSSSSRLFITDAGISAS